MSFDVSTPLVRDHATCNCFTVEQTLSKTCPSRPQARCQSSATRPELATMRLVKLSAAVDALCSKWVPDVEGAQNKAYNLIP